MKDVKPLIPGIYKHYKGNSYEVYDTATHSENLESLVVYRPMYGEKKLWVRPLSMFLESVEINGELVPRFEFVSASRDELTDGLCEV
jgi:hypothetical protein